MAVDRKTGILAVVVPSYAPSGDNAITATYNGSSTQAGAMLTLQP